ncbi:DM13 domain-containing protein [Streptomyces sp. enrichment culture]|uniref:DM13 domain-containing protein n=1 Tax=Streptomyces sp. enrichment culture TaxID=1795815 RepID=UPI003F54ABCF
MGRAGGGAARRVAAVAAVPAVALAGLGLYWFQPWRLWVDEEVREELPAAASRRPSPTATASGPPSSPAADPGPRTVADGALVTHEHRTTGTVRVLRLADGSHVLRFEGLDTSNGPDLHVWLTDAPVIEGKAGWHVFDDGKHVALGKLKGNKGDQNYPLPAGVDPADFRSVTIWCDRFDVSFGAAELTA